MQNQLIEASASWSVWTFAGSDEGGRRAAAVYSLIETCKLNGVDPRVWLAPADSFVARCVERSGVAGAKAAWVGDMPIVWAPLSSPVRIVVKNNFLAEASRGDFTLTPTPGRHLLCVESQLGSARHFASLAAVSISLATIAGCDM